MVEMNWSYFSEWMPEGKEEMVVSSNASCNWPSLYLSLSPSSARKLIASAPPPYEMSIYLTGQHILGSDHTASMRRLVSIFHWPQQGLTTPRGVEVGCLN
jgi:hypothetical protein